jgi:CelD/BcsL family acetyltransferase involved in cellulose biosynthesis
MHDPVTIEVARGAAAVGACVPLWDALRAADPDAPPLTGADYLLAIREALAPDVTPLCLVARRGESVVGVLPLGRKRVRRGAVRLRRLMPFAGRHSYFTDALVVPDGADETAHALAVALLAEARRGDDAYVQRIPRERPLGRALASLPGVTVVAESRNRIAPPSTLQGQPGREMRRRLRRLAERATATTVHVEHSEAVQDRFLAFAALHTAMMPERGLDAVLAAPRARSKVAELMARRAAEGTAGIVEIHVAGRLAASQVWLREADAYVAYRSAWNVEWTPYALGLHVIDELMQLVTSRSAAAVELGPGRETYKRKWGPTAQETITARVDCWTWRQRVLWWMSRARNAGGTEDSDSRDA